MGNRAVITDTNKKVGIYLHWDGGRNSVEAFLKYAQLQGVRNPIYDCYGWARLCQIIANFFTESPQDMLSIGIDLYDRLDTDNGDNGTYVIDEKWNIVDRLYFDGAEQKGKTDLLTFLTVIDKAQPVKMQLGADRIEEELKNETIRNS